SVKRPYATMPKVRASKMPVRKLEPLAKTWSKIARFLVRCDASRCNVARTRPSRASVEPSMGASRSGAHERRTSAIRTLHSLCHAHGEVPFVDRHVRFDHVRLRNRNDEASAGGSIGRLLAQHLATKIPDQQEDEIRLGLKQSTGIDDGNSLPWHQLPLFVGVGIDDVLKEFRSQIQIIDESRSLGGCAVTSDTLSALL